MPRKVESIEVLLRKSLKQSNTVSSRKVPNKTTIIGRMAYFDRNDHTTSVSSSVLIETLSDDWKRDYLDARRRKLLSSSSPSPDYQKEELTAYPMLILIMLQYRKNLYHHRHPYLHHHWHYHQQYHQQQQQVKIGVVNSRDRRRR